MTNSSSNTNINNMIIVTDAYGRQKTILTNFLPRTPKFFADGHLEQLDGLVTYDFSTLASDPATEHLIAGNNVIVRNKDHKLVMFTIIRTREERRDGKYVRTVFTENAAVDDLYNNICDGEVLTAVSARNAATKALAGTGWQVGNVDDAGLQNINLNEYPTSLAALHMIRDQYGLEIEFTVSFIGTKVRDRFVHLVKKRGNVTGKRFTYGKDLTGITREVDRSDLATAIIPIGKADETGKRLTMEDFQNVFEGYVSPKGQKWVGDDNALQIYGKDGKHLFKRLDLSSVENQYELMKRAVEELRRVMKPRVTYEISCLLLEALTEYEHEKVRLGDTILVKDTMFDPVLAVQARVIAIYRSYTDPSKDYVVLGEFIPLVIDKNRQIEAIQETINQNMAKWEQGGEVVYKSPNEPAASKRTDNMLWLDTSKVPNVMKRWDAENNRWVNASVTTPQEIGAETPEGAQEKANNAEDTAIAEAAEDAAIKAKKAEEKAIEVAEEMDESVKIELKSYVEGLTEEIEAAVKEHADQKAADAELNAKLFTEGYAEKEFHYGDTPPKDTTQIWFDMSSQPNKIRKYNEKTKTWDAASPTSPSDIGAASTQDAIDEANKAREEAIKKAKEEAKAAQDAAIKEAKNLDAAIKTEAERLSKAAEAAANSHTNNVTQQVEEALKKDSQEKANAALEEAKKLDAAIKADAEKLAKAAEEAAKGHSDSVAKQVEEALKKDSQNKANAAKEGAISDADKKILEAKKEAATDAQNKADAARDQAKKDAAVDAKAKADEAQRLAEINAKKQIDDMSNVERNILWGTRDKHHTVVNGAARDHTYFEIKESSYADIQGKTINMSFKLTGKVTAFGNTNRWIGLEVRIDFEDGTSQYLSARVENRLTLNRQYNRELFDATTQVHDKPIKKVTTYALARDFTGTVRLEEWKVGTGTKVTDYDQPLEEELEEVKATIGSASGQNLAINSAAKLGWIGWSATQTLPNKWTIVNINELAGFTKAFKLTNTGASTGENFLINTIPVGNIQILGNKVQFGGWIYNRSMTTGGIRYYARFRGKDAAGKEVLKYANAGAANDLRNKFWTWVTFEFNDWSGMTSLDEVRITANCLSESNGEAWVTGVMMKVSEVSSQWSPSPLDFEELASDAGVLTKGTLAAERLYGQTIDGNRANFVNLNATNISTGTLHADRIGANSVSAEKIAANAVTVDKLAANSVNASKLQANAVTAEKVAANAVTADKIAANAVNASKIAAGAITADKLHVLAKSLVANTSLTGNDSTGWNISKHATSTVGLRGSANMGDVLVHGFTTADHDTPTLYNSNYFEVDPNQSYKFNIGMFIDKNEMDGAQYFGVNAYDKNQKELPMQPINPTTGALSGDPRTNPYFWSGKEVSPNWRSMEGYVVSSQAGGNEAPQGRNIQSSYRMHPATKYLRMRFYSGYYPTNKTKAMEVLWHSPSVSRVDSGTIIADRITAGTIDANVVNVKNINASNITTGGMSADRVTSGTIDARKISVIGLNAGNIVAGSINAATIDITNIKAQNITSGTISADRIAAGSITGAKIAANAIDAGKIAAGSITTDKIAAVGISADKIASGTIDARKVNVIGLNAGNIVSGTIDASKIGVTNLNADNIKAGILSADRIAAGSITADKMVIGDFTNLCPNGNFEDGTHRGWHNGMTAIAANDASVPTGAPTKTVGRQTQRDARGSDWFPVKSGEQFYVSCDMASKNSNHGATLGVYFFNKDGVAVAASGSGYKTKQNGQWQNHIGYITAPANAVKAYVWTQINEFKDFGEWFFTNIEVRRRSDSSLLVDGAVNARVISANSVTAEKIVTNAITADKISANAVTVDKIAAGAVNASKIAANAIDAGKIAAGSITTEKIAAAGITADKITSGVLDANRVQVKNLNASVITAGTMSADRITSGTINATNTNIINLKAQNIASGTINADNVEISNGRVTINKDGVTVTDANFLVRDARTGLLHTTTTSTNLFYDHSFETLKADGTALGGIYYNVQWLYVSAVLNDSFFKWARVGTPKMANSYTYDIPTEASPFGLNAGLFNQANYLAQSFGASAGKQYTISFHAAKPLGGLAAGQPRLLIEHLKDNNVVHSQTQDFAIPVTAAGDYVRYGVTVTAHANIAGGRNTAIRVRFMTTNDNWCTFDGVQAVTGNRAAPYDAEDALWKFGQNRTTLDSVSVRNLRSSEKIWAKDIEATSINGTYRADRPMLRDHQNENVTVSAMGNDLYLGYYNTKKVIIHDATSFEVNSPNTEFKRGIRVTGTTSDGNAVQTSGNIRAFNGDILTNWAVKAAGFTFTQHKEVIYAGEGTMWYGWGGAGLGIYIFSGNSWRPVWINNSAQG